MSDDNDMPVLSIRLSEDTLVRITERVERFVSLSVEEGRGLLGHVQALELAAAQRAQQQAQAWAVLTDLADWDARLRAGHMSYCAACGCGYTEEHNETCVVGRAVALVRECAAERGGEGTT